ncbi:MAG: putative nucleotidyltransferase/HEPN domain-containing protein [Flavobacteriales bacterium]|jgi:predicted nucleotidyltransferase/HEPN domain-containing protein
MIQLMKTSLAHLPEHKQTNIQFLMDTIHDEFEQVRGFATSDKKKHSRIGMIILFGSYAKGSYVDDPVNSYVSDYDVLVVLNRSELVDEYRIWHTAEERISQKVKAPVNILVHTHAEVNDWLRQGHYFFRDIRAEGIQLYTYSGTALIEPGELNAADARTIAQGHFEQWFESAVEFYEYYETGKSKKQFKSAAFQLHQSTERFLSCILLVFTNYRPKTHNIKALNNLAAQHATQLTDIFPQDTKFNRRCFELLKRAYIESRYSEHYRITHEELAWLEKRVLHLQELTNTLCKEKIAAGV